MFNNNVSLLIRTFAAAKLIIYDENSANEYVNNCYSNGFFMCKGDSEKKWQILIAAHS